VKTVGFIINPIAGMGGRLGLKGTDGLAQKAFELGALPRAPEKAARALVSLKNTKGITAQLSFLAPVGEMGEFQIKTGNLRYRVIGDIKSSQTSATDTIRAAKKMVDLNVDLILFAGGDGTARDICSAVGEKIPVIGIPAGVKIHSPVFAQTPEKAGELAGLYLKGTITQTKEQEVLDIDEAAYRNGQVITRLYGYLKIPFERQRIQSRKAGTPLSESASQNLIALNIIDEMQRDEIYLIGPGTTTRPVLENLSLPNSLLGVDVICNKKILCKDANEEEILAYVKNRPFKIVITPIGGQGYLFGRGNHQLSPEVIQTAGKKNIIVAATLEKISGFRGRPFLIDSGDLEIDRMLSGYIRVTTGYRQEMIYPIE
jgi:predicted polyphosphate/ATP-dependent NAD kinase